jgi:hypothetical protein
LHTGSKIDLQALFIESIEINHIPFSFGYLLANDTRTIEMIEMIEEAASNPPYNKDIQVSAQEVSAMLDEANVNFRNVNTALETILVKILISKVR